MANVTLLRKSTSYDPSISSYKMILEIISSENIPKSVFVKQRIRNFFKNNFEDSFAAIATPVQLEDFDENSPKSGDSYFRNDKIELAARTPEYLEETFTSIQNEIQKLLIDYEALNELQADGIYTITATDVDINMAIQHTHYRLPLVARPAGNNEIYEDNDDVQRQRVSGQDTDLPGWLNTSGSDPSNYAFKYNIAKDSTLYSLFPPASDKIAYAHLEANGVTQTDVLINSTGVYWKASTYGDAPWPADYINSGDQGSPENAVVLVLDFIK